MLPTNDCDDCTPAYVRRSLDGIPPSTIAWSSLPFILTWIAVVFIAQRRVFPSLVSSQERNSAQDELPVFSKNTFQPVAAHWRERLRLASGKRLVQWVFSTSIGLSAVLVELLLCEISNTLNPAARALALRITLGALLVLLIVITPALETHGIAKALLSTPSDTVSTRRTPSILRSILGLALFGSWLLVFWYIPQASILREALHDSEQGHPESEKTFLEACLERIGIIGISLMAALAGFAAVSSLWQTFGVRYRTIKESDLARRSAGLSATEEMLSTKQSRVRALERKLSESASKAEQPGIFGKVIGTFRGSKEVQELNMLRMEVAGLQTMRFTLSTSLSDLHARHVEQERAKTSSGKMLNIANLVFAIYCAYRIGATSLSSLRRWWNPSHSFATSDPINNILAILTTHWDSNLDRAAWSRQFSFLLSGIMLLASFNAVLQTFRLFTRFAPGLLQYAQSSLPLIVAQVAGTYVISSALLLRSNLPAEASSVISESLGAPLEAHFVERWFETWFLVVVGLTATGILVGRKVAGANDDWDDDGSMEMDKRS